jgi:hypothetical protein
MMMRDDLQVALNDVVVALQDAADGHEQAREQLGDRSEADRLARLIEAHGREAETIGEQLRALGDRPREADPEYEAALGLFSRLKAGLAPDEVQSLLEDRAEAEARVAEAADLALERDDVPEDVVDVLIKVRDHARAAAGELGSAAD